MSGPVHIVAASVYSMGGELAHELTYSEGTKVRAVESSGGIIRREVKRGQDWRRMGKGHNVLASDKRMAGRVKAAVRAFLGTGCTGNCNQGRRPCNCARGQA